MEPDASHALNCLPLRTAKLESFVEAKRVDVNFSLSLIETIIRRYPHGRDFICFNCPAWECFGV